MNVCNDDMEEKKHYLDLDQSGQSTWYGSCIGSGLFVPHLVMILEFFPLGTKFEVRVSFLPYFMNVYGIAKNLS